MQSFCRTCFRQIFEGMSTPLISENYYNLMLCVPEMDLRILIDFKLCEYCAVTLNKTYKFKIKCQEVDDKINRIQSNVRERLIVTQEVNLNNSISAICRTCSVDIKDNNLCFLTQQSFYKHKLMLCVPEIDLQAISGVDLCKDCQTALDMVYTFKTTCIVVEKNIKEYLKQHDIIDFRELSVWCNPLVKNEINDIEDFTIKQEVDLWNKEEKINENVIYSKCEYNITQEYHFDKHVYTPIDDKPYKCLLCEYSSATKWNLKRHNRKHTGEKRFKCLHCEYVTAIKWNLIQHIDTHSGKKSFKCSSCKYSSTQKSHLKRHIRTHTGEKPFKCSHCKYSAAEKSHLQEHIHTHTGEKPFKCSQCEYSAAWKSLLRQHIHAHTAEKRFKCSHCGYSTAQEARLKEHINTHTGEKPFKCSYCKYSAAEKRILKQHIFTHTS